MVECLRLGGTLEDTSSLSAQAGPRGAGWQLPCPLRAALKWTNCGWYPFAITEITENHSPPRKTLKGKVCRSSWFSPGTCDLSSTSTKDQK